MKSIGLFLLALLMVSCGSKQNQNDSGLSDQFSNVESDQSVFEGQIPFNARQSLHLEVSLIPASAMDGRFSLKETVIGEAGATDPFLKQGFYSVFDTDGDERSITLTGTRRENALRRVYTAESGNIREENFRDTDLTFLLEEDALTLLNGPTPLSPDASHKLFKRATPVFTVEGYFQYLGDTALFYEMNTKQHWPLTKLGVYYQAAKEYNMLADKANDTIYLKATAYGIQYVSREKKRINALVLKSILQSSAK